MKCNIWKDVPTKPLPTVLSTIVDNRGKTVPTAEKGHKLIATNCIRNENLYPTYEKVRFLSDETYNSWFRAHPQANDIIFVCKGTPGRVCMVPNPVDFCIAQDMVALRADDSIVYNKYLLAVLRSRQIQMQITNTSVGDVIPHFKKSHFDQVKIPLPDMWIQKRIGDIYFSFLHKIELNNQMNKNLEAQAQAIFKSWFVDFEPWGGVMPEDWREGTLGECIELLDNKRVPLSGNERNKMQKIYPYYGAAACMDYVDDYLFDGVYLLFSEDGANVVDDNGYPLLQYVWGKFWVNNHAHILNGKNGFSVEMLYTMLKTTNSRSAVTGAVQPKINQANLRNIKVIIPVKEILRKCDGIVQPLFKSLRKNIDEMQTLTALRDTLLPKLMSGEIDVKEVG